MQRRLTSAFANEPGIGPLLRTFVAGLSERCDELGLAIAASDLDELRICAHKLKGAAGGYGFRPIADEAAAIVAAIDAGESGPELATRLRALRELCARARPATPTEEAR